MAKVGAPTTYTEELADKICQVIATHPFGLKKLHKMYYGWFPDETTIYDWKWRHSEFALRYAQAKLAQADILAQDCLDIADDISNDTITKINKDGEEYEVSNNEWINRSRLRVDTRKWLASKLLPKVYGDKNRMDELEDENKGLKQEMAELRAQLDEKYKKEY